MNTVNGLLVYYSKLFKQHLYMNDSVPSFLIQISGWSKLNIWPTVHRSYWWYWKCEMSPATSLPHSFYLEAGAELSKQQSPSVSHDSLLGMDGSGTITCRPVTPFGLINVPRPPVLPWPQQTHTHWHTNTRGLCKSTFLHSDCKGCSISASISRKGRAPTNRPPPSPTHTYTNR